MKTDAEAEDLHPVSTFYQQYWLRSFQQARLASGILLSQPTSLPVTKCTPLEEVVVMFSGTLSEVSKSPSGTLMFFNKVLVGSGKHKTPAVDCLSSPMPRQKKPCS